VGGHVDGTLAFDAGAQQDGDQLAIRQGAWAIIAQPLARALAGGQLFDCRLIIVRLDLLSIVAVS